MTCDVSGTLLISITHKHTAFIRYKFKHTRKIQVHTCYYDLLWDKHGIVIWSNEIVWFKILVKKILAFSVWFCLLHAILSRLCDILISFLVAVFMLLLIYITDCSSPFRKKWRVYCKLIKIHFFYKESLFYWPHVCSNIIFLNLAQEIPQLPNTMHNQELQWRKKKWHQTEFDPLICWVSCCGFETSKRSGVKGRFSLHLHL